MVDVFTAKPLSRKSKETTQTLHSVQIAPVTSTLQQPSNTSQQLTSPGIFASFFPNPEMSFSSQNENETIYLLLRRHIITNTPWIITIVLLLIAPLFLLIAFHLSNPLAIFFPSGISHSYTIIFSLFYYLAVISSAFVYFLSWFYSISLVTSEQVYDIDFSSLVYKEVSATRMHLVEDVTATQVGSIRSFFDYGDVLVQTAGTLDNFDMMAIPHPTKVANTIEDLLGKEEAESEDKESDHG